LSDKRISLREKMFVTTKKIKIALVKAEVVIKGKIIENGFIRNLRMR